MGKVMNNIEVRESERPTNLEEIAEFEKLIGAKLPEDYKQFLLKHNGGHPLMDTFDLLEPINEHNLTTCMSWFYALYEGDVCNLSLTFKYSRHYEHSKHILTDKYIPIASCNSDDLCIVIKGEDYGKVFYFTRDWSFWKEEELDRLYLVSNSFTDFINGLKSEELEKDGSWTITYQDGRVEKRKSR